MNRTKTCEVLAWCPVEDDRDVPEYADKLNYSRLCDYTIICGSKHAHLKSDLVSVSVLRCCCLQRTTLCSSKTPSRSPHSASRGDGDTFTSEDVMSVMSVSCSGMTIVTL